MSRFLKLWVIPPVLLALAVLFTWTGVEIALDGEKLTQRSRIEAPAEQLVQDPEDSVEAFDHVRQAGASDNLLRIEAKTFSADWEHWHRHAVNTAAQRGWYPHSVEDDRTRMIVPERDRELLDGISVDPYGWLEEMRSNGPAMPPRLGDNPVHVTISTVHADYAPAKKYGQAILILLFALFLLGPTWAVMMKNDRSTAIRNERT